ncbi:MAG: ABC transporter permease [Oscillospiraceae bacterium]|nr:ABC transporter permease [Oscillospiraceae bacterium]
MNRIFRLGIANIRRRKTESVLLALMVMLCMLLLGGSVAAEQTARCIFPDMMERTGAWDHEITYTAQSDDPVFAEYLAEDDRVADYAHFNYLFSMSMLMQDQSGKEQSSMMCFITEQNEKQYEIYRPVSAWTDAEIAAAAHPIRIPLNQKDSLRLKEGDPFVLTLGAKKFTFTVIGFYETSFFSYGQYLISDADYAVLRPLCTEAAGFGFKAAAGIDSDGLNAICSDFEQKCRNTPGTQFEACSLTDYQLKKDNFNTDIVFILRFLEVMAGVIILSVAVMIGHRIITDIQEQIVSIGVLEALGYRSGEIALSYAAEYFLIAQAGCTAGTAGALVLYRVLVKIAEYLSGYASGRSICWQTLLICFAAVLLFSTLLAFMKARSVRKYPPVTAFRKGIGTHHFGRSHFPLRKTKGNVHLRLALKGFADNAKQNIRLTFVVSITTLAVVLSFILYGFLGKGSNVVLSIAGHEMSDLQLEIMPAVDAGSFAAELESMPEIRKVLPRTESMDMSVVGCNFELMADVFDDYTRTENIHPCDGRFPAHDNEVMLTKTASSAVKLTTGDSITLECGGVRRDYLITGIVTAFINADSVYFTADGYRRLVPDFAYNLFEVYVSEDMDPAEVRSLLDQKYGRSAASLGAETENSGSLEERIRQRAEQVTAALMQQEGITHLDYAIQIGDQIITGDSSKIMIKDYMNWPEMVTSLLSTLVTATGILTRLFMVISAVVVMVLLFILMKSEIRRQRRTLGIMKSMGYTSRELMLQLAFRIMPAAALAVVIGTVLGVTATKLLVNYIGAVPVNLPSIIAVDILILLFCFGCAYFGARHIKKISVYELMTE